MDSFILEQSKCSVEEAIAKFRKLKFELGEKPFKTLLKNSKAWRETYERYEDFLINEQDRKLEWAKKDFDIKHEVIKNGS